MEPVEQDNGIPDDGGDMPRSPAARPLAMPSANSQAPIIRLPPCCGAGVLDHFEHARDARRLFRRLAGHIRTTREADHRIASRPPRRPETRSMPLLLPATFQRAWRQFIAGSVGRERGASNNDNTRAIYRLGPAQFPSRGSFHMRLPAKLSGDAINRDFD